MSTAPEARPKRRVSYTEGTDILASCDPVLAGLIRILDLAGLQKRAR